LFGRWAKTTGFATSLTVLGFAGSLGLPFLAGVVAGDIFASEDRHGTWKTLLTRSCTRVEIFARKAIAVSVTTVEAIVVLAVSSLLTGLAAIGSSSLVGLSGQLITPAKATVLILESWAYVLLPTLMFVALAMLLSAATRSGIAGVLGTGVV